MIAVERNNTHYLNLSLINIKLTAQIQLFLQGGLIVMLCFSPNDSRLRFLLTPIDTIFSPTIRKEGSPVVRGLSVAFNSTPEVLSCRFTPFATFHYYPLISSGGLYSQIVHLTSISYIRIYA